MYILSGQLLYVELLKIILNLNTFILSKVKSIKDSKIFLEITGKNHFRRGWGSGSFVTILKVDE